MNPAKTIFVVINQHLQPNIGDPDLKQIVSDLQIRDRFGSKQIDFGIVLGNNVPRTSHILGGLTKQSHESQICPARRAIPIDTTVRIPSSEALAVYGGDKPSSKCFCRGKANQLAALHRKQLYIKTLHALISSSKTGLSR